MWAVEQTSPALLGLHQDKAVQVTPTHYPSVSPADLDKVSRDLSRGTCAANQHCPAHCRLLAPLRGKKVRALSLHFVRRQLTTSPAENLGLMVIFGYLHESRKLEAAKTITAPNFGGLGTLGLLELVSLE